MVNYLAKGKPSPPASVAPAVRFLELLLDLRVLPSLCASDSSKPSPTDSVFAAQNTANRSLLVPDSRQPTAEGSNPPPNMDVVLEIADSFIFDPLYATLLPGASAQPFVANATFSSFKEEPTGFAVPHATWQYEPSTHFFSIKPSKYAYMSAWNRDDWQRQALSLYLITWYAPLLRLSQDST